MTSNVHNLKALLARVAENNYIPRQDQSTPVELPVHPDPIMCGRHGWYTDECSKCKEFKEGLLKINSNEESKNVKSYLEEIGIPPRFFSAHFRNLVCDAHNIELNEAITGLYSVSQAFGVFSSTGGNITLAGNTGVGKTHLAVSFVKELLMNTGAHVRFYVASELVTKILFEKKYWQEYTKNIGLLVLDDLGAVPMSEFHKTILFSILNDRYNRQQPTFITTNFSLDELKIYLGDRLYSRIILDKHNLFFKFVGKDFRQ